MTGYDVNLKQDDLIALFTECRSKVVTSGLG